MAHEFNDDTLDDIKARDVFNLEVFLNKKGWAYKKFQLSSEASEFQGRRVEMILAFMGVNFQRGLKEPDYFDNIFKEKNMKVENRVYDEPEDEWRSGVYIYKSNEIAGFVGYPIYDPEKIENGFRVMYTERL
jgi:hypothetical protein